MNINSVSFGKTRANLRWGIVGIFGLLLITVAIAAPQYANKGINFINDKVKIGLPNVPEKSFRLGLDLQGGVQLIYKTDLTGIEANKQALAVEGVRDVIERRVNGLGVAEANVQTSQIDNTYRVNIELPGVTDVNQAIKMIGETPTLEFKEEGSRIDRPLTDEEQQSIIDYNVNAKNKANALLERLNKGESFESLVSASEESETKDNAGLIGFIPDIEPVKELYAWAKNQVNTSTSNTISKDLIQTPQGFNIVKRGSERDGQPEVQASHILICWLGSKNCEGRLTKEEAKNKAETLFKKATPKNFAQLAKENSSDLSNKATGGDLGYFTKEKMVPEFASAAFEATKGTIIGPIETAFGYHLIYKRDARQEKEYEISRILIRTKTAVDILGPNQQWKSTGLSGKQLQRAEVVTDQQTGGVQVSLKFNSEGAQLFKELTTRNLQKPIAIFLDGFPISTPNVNTVIPDGNAVISGRFSFQEAKILAQRLNAGALPVPVELISQQAIGATLGAESLAKSLKAGAMSLAVIMIFMIAVYRLPGLISVVSLCLYTALTLVIFKLLGVTITLAGIAGFIMSLGVAIDANVLIFERLKEELQQGKSLRLAVEEGFLRAWTSIRDGNAATLITSVILIWFGSSFVKGFALTLIIGTLVSLFTAITVTRVMVRFIVPWFKNEGSWLFLGSKK
ncbi:MAG: protein-export membrane protein SecD [Candidatus Magasanikbacteria bacterium RIFCSPHIGHO2_01_FULL_41_23]|uniref:Protein translocase subunit SecD n=1 Tax=Candidatus Magasanikbacteria bacterium RIFCSPLOWO2_01_FULL_40_15 TaxID=1798686 RepID=A0A1F6N489_9BACT|nr:MAG: protein-export membrane protein SecD [Candidatus Magasanikbacteria bacterium RIFCSPHIGHO2_01_FULL_41_23]OGH76570.1 MAG: protein-export membrane protein SecD [Candidatus Magasanikbacteria bacterium RIFCSPHIGHO2_12_FULL_41_16]OGH78548.1 MAG: protein-export membrane protein SecD [Candidatus Magasanikbacteria bacterium RIFCSPLOWO2_01_FULL_40_15]